MGIRVMQERKFDCDNCGRTLAKIKASKEVFDVIDEEAKYITVECACPYPYDFKKSKV